jgi:YfiH family protein
MTINSSIIKSKIFSQYDKIIHGISVRIPNEPPHFNNLSRNAAQHQREAINNQNRFYSQLGINPNRIAAANQIHSSNITVVDNPGIYKNTDAFITNKPNLFLTISVADCAAVMIYDPVSKSVANIHSGWRGTLNNITGKTISEMNKYFGSNPNDFIVYISPSISKNNFEVNQDVADLFPNLYKEKKLNSNGKYLIDLKKMIYVSLINEGVLKDNIEISDFCTFESPFLHSYRRDKAQSGRMFAVIGLI